MSRSHDPEVAVIGCGDLSHAEALGRRDDRGIAHRGDHPGGARPVALIIDAGPLGAYVDADDAHHNAYI